MSFNKCTVFSCCAYIKHCYVNFLYTLLLLLIFHISEQRFSASMFLYPRGICDREWLEVSNVMYILSHLLFFFLVIKRKPVMKEILS